MPFIFLYDPASPPRCQGCGEVMPPGGDSIRPMQWFHHGWHCGHGTTWACSKCDDDADCPVCGTTCEYT
jgi:hypothetical protein